MEIWPIVALAIVALTAYDFMFGKDMEHRWILLTAFWVLFAVLLLSVPSCRYGGGEFEDPDIPYSF